MDHSQDEPIEVRWCVYCNDDEREEWFRGILVEVQTDSRGLFARVNDGGDGLLIVDLWRFDNPSYKKAMAAYPQFWDQRFISE